MKRKIILLSTVAVLGLAGTFLVSNPNKEGAYSERTTPDLGSQQGEYANGMLEWMATAKEGFGSEERKRAVAEANALPQNRSSIGFKDHGPDNIGGRTRAIVVDRNDINHIYAGSVSGGLFESFNRANTWSKVEAYSENLAISSMCQTSDGTLYVATGHEQEVSPGEQTSKANGNGVYRSLPDESFELIAGTENFSRINEVVADTLNNQIWIAASSDGLRKYTPADGVAADSPIGTVGRTCDALSISPDGQVLVADIANRTHISTDFGVSFNDVTQSGPDKIGSTGSGRYEYAISHEKLNGKYVIYASVANSTSRLEGVWRTKDYGASWNQIAPKHDRDIPGSFGPFSIGKIASQGKYNNIISVQKGNPNRVFLGGILCYTWRENGNWEQTSVNFSPTFPNFVHSDVHEFTWDKTGRLYVGSDGGVGISTDFGETFYTANRGYNVTQFYGLGFNAHGDVNGGAQDNGSMVNYHDNSTYQEHKQFLGGDGFASSMSFINRDIIFGTVFHEIIFRSSDRGNSIQSFSPPLEEVFGCNLGVGGGSGGNCGQFYTRIKLWEDPNDIVSEDTLIFISSQTYKKGDLIEIPSRVSGKFIPYTTPSDVLFDDTLFANPVITKKDTVVTSSAPAISLDLNEIPYEYTFGGPSASIGDSIRYLNESTMEFDTIEVAQVSLEDHFFGINPLRPGLIVDMGRNNFKINVTWDTIRVIDPLQSWLASGAGSGQGVWLTRNALRFSDDPSDGWIQVAGGLSRVTALEFSQNGEHLFIGCSSGDVWRLSGFNDVYSPVRGEDTLIDWNTVHSATTLTNIGNASGPVFGIATGSDPDHLVVATGTFSGTIRESVNATGAAPSWNDIGASLPRQPFYACVIDRNDPDIIMAGGEVGLFATTTGGVGVNAWEYCTGDFGNTPVHNLGQNFRTWDEGCRRPGEIYVGTHGRGIWSTDEYLGLPSDKDNLSEDKFVSNITVYPNPVNDIGNIAFNLTESSDVLVQIFNLNGQIVNEIKEVNNSEGANNITLETGSLPKGTYIVRLIAGETVETSKFIKQ